MSALPCVVLQVISIGLIGLLMWKGKQLMSNVADIKQQVADLGTAVGSIATDLAALEAKIPAAGSGETLSDDDAASIKSGLKTAIDALNTANAAAQSVLNPPPTGN